MIEIKKYWNIEDKEKIIMYDSDEMIMSVYIDKYHLEDGEIEYGLTIYDEQFDEERYVHQIETRTEAREQALEEVCKKLVTVGDKL